MQLKELLKRFQMKMQVFISEDCVLHYFWLVEIFKKKK